jgi:hypothetical protein
MNTEPWKIIARNLAVALEETLPAFQGSGFSPTEDLTRRVQTALADYAAALAPVIPPDITLAPGRYKMGGDRPSHSLGVVLGVVDGTAYGYHECGGKPAGSLSWAAKGGFFGSGEAPDMNLVERLPDV